MQLTDEQKKIVAGWLEEGLRVADVQEKLVEEFSVSMTYMEVRFLLDDLALAPKDPVEEVVEKPDAEEAKESEVTDGNAVLDDPGNVSVTVDQVVRPGALASGKVTFSDGKSAAWYLDELGRLGLVADDKSYKPSQEDVMAFQTKLQDELARMRI